MSKFELQTNHNIMLYLKSKKHNEILENEVKNSWPNAYLAIKRVLTETEYIDRLLLSDASSMVIYLLPLDNYYYFFLNPYLFLTTLKDEESSID